MPEGGYESRWGGGTLATSFLGLVLVLAGCASSGLPTPAAGPSATPTGGSPASATATDGCSHVTDSSGKQSQPPNLESRLYDLVVAENQTSHATAHDLRLRNGAVEVVVELVNGTELPQEFDISVQARHDTLVQAYVPVCELVPLSEHENVSLVRSPVRPDPDEPSLDFTGS